MGHITRLRRNRLKSKRSHAYSKNVAKAIAAGQVSALDVLQLYLDKARKVTMADISLIHQNNDNGNKNQTSEEE